MESDDSGTGPHLQVGAAITPEKGKMIKLIKFEHFHETKESHRTESLKGRIGPRGGVRARLAIGVRNLQTTR